VAASAAAQDRCGQDAQNQPEAVTSTSRLHGERLMTTGERPPSGRAHYHRTSPPTDVEGRARILRVNSIPPPPASAEPGWHADPIASDMLRWWDGAAWSETEFKLARLVLPAIKPETRRDLLLGPVGRLGSLFNIAMCGLLVVGGLVIALTLHPLGWGLVATGIMLEVIFVATAMLIRRFKVPQRLTTLIWGPDQR
jgi:hypothetical protein